MAGSAFTVSLPHELAALVRARVGSGAFASSSALIREAVRRLALTAAIPEQVGFQEQRVDRKRARTAVRRLLRMRTATTLGAGVSVLDLRNVGRR
ncbi:MAG: ribbon-helix-helix protein, CopG family [Planctomycetes bacterium]|nr:ribbon-helix-helix protein, CopG family [Planctomycetota bacterium]